MSLSMQNTHGHMRSCGAVTFPVMRIFSLYAMASYCCSAVGLKVKLKLIFPEKVADLQFPSSCQDLHEVDRSRLALYGHLNDLGDSVKFWSSAVVTKKMKHIENIKVAGLNGQTIGDIFEVLRQNGCYPFLYGGSVRDQILDQPPVDADIEVDCTLAELLRVCVDNWGEYNCKRYPHSHIAHIGNVTMDRDLEIIDLGTTTSTFYASIYDLEYTVNSLAFDMNVNDVIIDLTGTGVRDACGQLIRIPSIDDSEASWKMWLNSTGGALYRFWKLRVKGLLAYNSDTRRFIIENAKKKIEAEPWSFPTFYCHYVFQSKYDRRTNMCRVRSRRECEKGLSRAVQYNSVLSEDLGEFWIHSVIPHYLPRFKEDCSEFHV